MEKRRRVEMMKVNRLVLLLLALLQISTPSSALSTTSSPTTTSAPNPAGLEYRTRPADVRVALGEPAVFRCGVPVTSPNLTFTLYSSHGNYSLTCPQGHMEDIPQALYGSCEVKDRESLAVWTIKGTSFSDNGTRVECQQSNNPDKRVAVLRVYDNGTNYAILIGCVIGGFFGMLLVVVLVYITLQRSETFQECFRGNQAEGDTTTIVTKE
ncbi:uncharacterized protein [Labrus bergylta]|uniref:uncharacterized protein n=1 Tax=Labrus bergylta TaxID=56723 RepID=UPI0033133258